MIVDLQWLCSTNGHACTVHEALLFSERLRHPRLVPDAEKGGLVDHADASVGYLSIEHKKRTTTGVKLVAKVRYQAASNNSY
jgi:hypothetical protein